MTLYQYFTNKKFIKDNKITGHYPFKCPAGKMARIHFFFAKKLKCLTDPDVRKINGSRVEWYIFVKLNKSGFGENLIY